MRNEATVFIVDDDDAALKSLQWLVESFGHKVEPFEKAVDFLDAYQTNQAGVLLLDAQMPGTTGIELQNIMRNRRITLPIIFITGHGDIEMAVRTIKKGAVDFLTKPINNHVLLKAINHAIKEDSKQRDANKKAHAIAGLIETLTPREHEVMQLMLSGNSTKAIAYALNISSNTVDIHRAKVMKKMGVKSAGELSALMSKI